MNSMPKFGKGDQEKYKKILSDLLYLCACEVVSCNKFCDWSAL